MKILFISELYPQANKGGEFIRNSGLYKLLVSSEHQIFAILGEDLKPDSLKNTKSINYLTFDFSGHYSNKLLKDALLKYKKQPDLIKLINNVLGDFKPDLVFIDYYYYGQYISFFKKQKIKVIYGTHNVQSRINLQNPVTSLKSKISRYLGFILFRFHELYYLRKADAIIAVSEDDLKFYKKWFSSVRLYNIPNFLDEKEYSLPEMKKEDYIIMTGNFNAFQNAQGLKWFLEKVWDNELSSKTKLLVAGRASDKVYREISTNADYSGVTAIGEVDDMKPYLTKAKGAIVPLLHGSGTRLKCIESMALRTQLISTSLGAEGIDHSGSILISDNPNDFKSNIFDTINNKIDHTAKAYSIFLMKYSLQGNVEIFNKLVHEIVDS